MSEFLREFRAKYPEYDDLGNDQLVDGLHKKYSAEVAPDMSLDQFKSSIGYMGDVQPPAPAAVPAMQNAPVPQPMQQQTVPGLPQQKSMFDLVTEKLTNYGAGAGERAGDIGASLLGGIQTLAKPLDEKFNTGMIGFEEGSFIPKYFSAAEVQRRQVPSYLEQGQQQLESVDLGYAEDVSWDDVKRSYKGEGLSLDLAKNVAQFGLEKGIQSIPDMAAAMASLPVYVLARSQEIGEARAKNSGRETATARDLLEASPFALGSAVLERIGAKGITDELAQKTGQELLQAGFANATARVAASGGKALTKEASTEAVQEGMIEYLGERFGTDAAMSFAEAAELGLAGAVAGGVFGGAAGTTAGTAREAQLSGLRARQNLDRPAQSFRIDNTQPGDAVVRTIGGLAPAIDQARFQVDEQSTIDAFNPNSPTARGLEDSAQPGPKVNSAPPQYDVKTEGLAIDQGQRQAPDVNVGFTPEIQQAEPEKSISVPEIKKLNLPERTKRLIGDLSPDQQQKLVQLYGERDALFDKKTAPNNAQVRVDMLRDILRQIDTIEMANFMPESLDEAQTLQDSIGAENLSKAQKDRIKHLLDAESGTVIDAEKMPQELPANDSPISPEQVAANRQKQKEQLEANTKYIEMTKQAKDRFASIPLDRLQFEVDLLKKTIKQYQDFIESNPDEQYKNPTPEQVEQFEVLKENAANKIYTLNDQLSYAQPILDRRLAKSDALEQTSKTVQESIDGGQLPQDLPETKTNPQSTKDEQPTVSAKAEKKEFKAADYSSYKKDPAKPQYHGTSNKIQRLDDFTYASLNFYGQGLYTTDSQSMAKGYTKKGKGSDPALYEVRYKREPKLYDMEQELDTDLRDYLRSLESDMIDFALDESSTLREVYDVAREYSSSYQVSADNLQEDFQAVADHLEKKGFDGLRHVGGRLTKQEPHNVEIIFNPRKLVDLQDVEGQPAAGTQAIAKIDLAGKIPETIEEAEILRDTRGEDNLSQEQSAAVKTIIEAENSADQQDDFKSIEEAWKQLIAQHLIQVKLNVSPLSFDVAEEKYQKAVKYLSQFQKEKENVRAFEKAALFRGLESARESIEFNEKRLKSKKYSADSKADFKKTIETAKQYINFIERSFSEKGYTAKQDYAAFQEGLKNQSLKVGDIKADYDRLLANKEAVLAELNSRAFTKAILFKMANTPRSDANKKQLAGMAYSQMLQSHVMFDNFAISVRYGETFEDQYTALVEKQTQADVDAYYSSRAAKEAKAQEFVESVRKSIQNPETLQEFKTFIEYKGKDALSQEQLARYDELVADTLSKDQQAPVIKAQDKKLEYTRTQVKHAKKGIDLYVVSLKERLGRADYDDLLSKAKSLNGYYSTYAKDGAVPGFQFKTKSEADAFADILDGRNVDASGFAEAKAEIIQSKNADKLSALADSIEAKAQASLSADRKANTAKRAREAGYAIENAEKQLRFAMLLRKLAAGLVNGDFKHLNNISAATQLETLQKMKLRYRPTYNSVKEDPPGLETYISKVKIPSVTITKADAIRNENFVKGASGFGGLRALFARARALQYDDSVVNLDMDEALLIQKAKKKKVIPESNFWQIDDVLQSVKRLEKLGITTDEQLRAALRELESLTTAEPQQPKTEKEIARLERELVGVKIPGYFPTPNAIIDEMIEIADIQPNDKILEPSAGKGNIADRIVSLVPDVEQNIEVVERQSSLKEILKLKGYQVVADDFLEHTGNYDKILMNPPFENFQDIDHVRHAYDLLNPNGTIVAIMSAGIKNSRTKAREFREWLDFKGGYFQDLPAGSFKTAERPTGVNTVMVVLTKPDAGVLNMGMPKADPQVLNATGSNHIATYGELGLPPRYETFIIDSKVYEMPEKPQRHEPIMQKLIEIAGPRIYFAKIKGKSTAGFYRRNNGEIRTRKKNDIEILAHELAHYLDDYSNVRMPNFKGLYLSDGVVNEVMALSYTDSTQELQQIEGFAEFVRLWATNSHEAKTRAPTFYKAFNELLAKDQKLHKQMKQMQLMMHRFYLQGPDKLGQALIGKDEPIMFTLQKWSLRRNSRIRQQMIDRFHAARRIEQDLTGRISSAGQSAWKLLRIANGGAEGITDYIMNYGTVNYNADGDLVKTGKGLHEVLSPVKTIKLLPEHKNEAKLDLLLRYFVGKRAQELQKQGREKLIPVQTAQEWADYDQKYPIFASIHAEYQEFNKRNLDFYVKAGILSKEGKAKFIEMNKNYVPFFRIREALEDGGDINIGQGFKRLKGGTSNLRDIMVNIQDGLVSNTQAAMRNKAKQVLYTYIDNNQDGSFYAARLEPDSRPVKVLKDELKAKVRVIFKKLGLDFDEYFEANRKDSTQIDPDTLESEEYQRQLKKEMYQKGMDDIFTDEMMMFWQVGIKPTLNESGNAVDVVMIKGKPKYYEVQDPMLQEMLLGMSPYSYGYFMKTLFAIKNGFTRSITLGAEFTGANLVRDTIGAAFISKGRFIPFYSSFKGMYSFLTRNELFQDFLRSGGGYSSRLEGMSKEGAARRRVRLKEFGASSIPEKIFSTIDNIASAFEYGTRIGEFEVAKKAGETYMEAGFRAREISTDFAVTGANALLTGYIRTVPFLNAMIQSQDRVYREMWIKKKYDGNPTAFAALAFLGVTIPTLLLWLINKDDEDYQEIPEYERRTNWHIKTGSGRFVKIPRPYDVGFVFGTMPELFMNYTEKNDGKQLAEGLVWTMTQMYGVDGVPAVATGFLDLYRDKKWTGAPVVSSDLKDVSPVNQFNANTSETFIRFGEMTNMSPQKSEHVFKAYTGYLGGYVLAMSDRMLWDEELLGERPDADLSANIFLRRFITPEARPSTSAMERFYRLKDDADRFAADLAQKTKATRLMARGKTTISKDELFEDDESPVGYTAEEKQVLAALKPSMDKLSRLVYGDRGLRTAELAIRVDKRLSGEEKRQRMDELWRKKAKIFNDYMKSADKALQKARESASKTK